MNAEAISLAGRTAVVTGAGRGLGRAYALALAARGAAVLVNDLGTDANGEGTDSAIARATCDEIIAKGGRAAADCSDVSTPQGGEAIIARALDAFGRIDIVIANAGICTSQPFAEATLADFEHYWRIHLGGHVNIAKAAWPHFVAQGYGRMIMTESGAGLFGLRGQATYSAAKGAVHGLMRTLAIEGRDHGILVNAVNPGGFSRMHEAAITDAAMLQWTRTAMPPEYVAPAIVWMASDRCTVSGEVFSVWAGRVARVAIGSGDGLFDRALSPELIAANYSRVAALAGFSEPADSLAEVSDWLTRHPQSL